MSGAPIISGMNQLPKPPISAGMTVKKIMIRPCDVTIVFHSCPDVTIVAVRLHQLRPHDLRQDAADHAGEHREHQIQRTDVLVVGTEKPARHETRRMAVVHRHGHRDRG